MEKVSAIVVCHDRENEIEPCLESVRWADELIVVDSFSADRTPERAKKYADKFFQREYVSAAAQRNWALQHASHPWILVIDADEVMPAELRDEIRRELARPRHGYYKAWRRGFFLGKEIRHCGWDTDKTVVLFRKDRYRYREDEVHPRLVPPDPEFGFFQNRLIHYTHRSIDEFVRKSNRYATWGARKYFRKGRRGTAAKMFFHALFNFFKMYIFRRGFLDGARGLVVSTLSSCYVAEKYAKLWEMTEEERERPAPPSAGGDGGPDR